MINPFDNEERRNFREIISRFVETEIKPWADEWDESEEIMRDLAVRQMGL